MYIEPDSIIHIFSGLPIDNTYEHTIYFRDIVEQRKYFAETVTTKYALGDYIYQRYSLGVIRVGIRADYLYDCNYLEFQNRAFGDKWFYAFITKIVYVSNDVSEIHYELDVMQTWFFDYRLEECFIVRQHSETDELFENLVEENLDLGETPVCVRKNEFDMNAMRVCIVTSCDIESEISTDFTFPSWMYKEAGNINNVYTPLYYFYNLQITDQLVPGSSSWTWIKLLKEIVNMFIIRGWEDKIVGIYEYPAFMSEHGGQPTDDLRPLVTVLNGTPTGSTPSITTLDGYVPKNKKLFNYPYSFLNVSNNDGVVATYKYEDWADPYHTSEFRITGSFVGGMPTALCYPAFHRGIEDDYDSGLTYNKFPQCAWVGDVYKAYWAQHQNVSNMSVVSATLGAITGSLNIGAAQYDRNKYAQTGEGRAIMGTGTSAVVNTATNLLNASVNVQSELARLKDLENVPPQVHGQITNDTLNLAIGRCKFTFYNMSIKAQYAKRIDDYFTKYGYKQNTFAVPNLKARPHWTYIQTMGCMIVGYMPNVDSNKIASIFDKGITFWVYGSEVGNYGVDNSPIATP